jgi:hypothetical protein
MYVIIPKSFNCFNPYTPTFQYQSFTYELNIYTEKLVQSNEFIWILSDIM